MEYGGLLRQLRRGDVPELGGDSWVSHLPSEARFALGFPEQSVCACGVWKETRRSLLVTCWLYRCGPQVSAHLPEIMVESFLTFAWVRGDFLRGPEPFILTSSLCPLDVL